MESNTLTNSSQTSNATDQETQQSTAEKRPRKPPKHTKSKFWDHCVKGARKLSDGTEQQIGICKYCKVEIPTVYGSTSGLKNHLVKRCKSSPLYEGSGNDKSQTILTNETMGQGSALVPHTFNQKRCELKVARYVIVDEVSFRAVEGNGFVELLHELQPRFKIPDRKKVASMVYDIFLVEKAKIRSVIADQRVSITTDTWTSIQNINYMVVTAHFLDSDWKLHKRIISFTKITSHSGEEIGKMKVTIRKLGCTPTSIKEFVDRVKQNLVTLWTEYKGMNDVLNAENQNMQIECDDGYGDTSGGKEGLCDELFDDVEAQNEEEQLQEISNEVDKYLADEIEKRSNQSFNLLEWWKGSETRYPILSMIAKDIFSIPCSTVASESAFSLGKRVVDPFRSSLSPKMVEALVCTSDWLRAEEFSFWKDPTDDDLELYKEIEEIEKAASATQDCANTSSSPSTLV